MYIYIYTCVYIYIYICICHVYKYIYVCSDSGSRVECRHGTYDTYIHICIYVYLHRCVHIYIYVYDSDDVSPHRGTGSPIKITRIAAQLISSVTTTHEPPSMGPEPCDLSCLAASWGRTEAGSTVGCNPPLESLKHIGEGSVSDASRSTENRHDFGLLGFLHVNSDWPPSTNTTTVSKKTARELFCTSLFGSYRSHKGWICTEPPNRAKTFEKNRGPIIWLLRDSVCRPLLEEQPAVSLK